jgi:hypothetical protein
MAVGKPGNAKVESRIRQLQSDEQANQHSYRAPNNGCNQKFPDNLIVVFEMFKFHRGKKFRVGVYGFGF